MNTLRVDKWLWAARFFKTRSLAVKACELNRVQVAGHPVKPSREVRAGDFLRVRTDTADFEVEVLDISDQRGPATVARLLYEETPASEAARAAAAEQRRSMPQLQVIAEGKPTKKARRQYDQFRGR